MPHNAKILADSISPDGVRLTTFELTYPRIVHAEMMTHRMFSRNAASSRAIPVKKLIKMVVDDPYIPSVWGSNKKGMQAGEAIPAETQLEAEAAWLKARDVAVVTAQLLSESYGVHKQLTNRLLEPFQWYTAIFTATEYANFFHLRCNPMAHPDIQAPARMMQELYEVRTPVELDYGAWHLPLIDPEDVYRDGEVITSVEERIKISAARCARVSYLTHEGKRDLAADIELHDKLLTSGHMSPFEHVARPAQEGDWKQAMHEFWHVEDDSELDLRKMWFGNLRGWVSYRKLIPNEADIMGAPPMALR